MRKLLLMIVVLSMTGNGFCQSKEAEQLLLNWEKLGQLKVMLKEMYKGYEIISKGYTKIRDIASGNFSLHKGFLDGLMEVSPAVKSYKRVADILSYQVAIVKLGKKALAEFEGAFKFSEAEHISKVYSNLFKESVKNIEELLLVITDGQLRMSDDERLQAIDRIYAKVNIQFSFLQDFTNSTAYLALQRKTERAEIELARKLRGF